MPQQAKQPQAAEGEVCLVQLLPHAETSENGCLLLSSTLDGRCCSSAGTAASTLAWELHFRNI